VEILGEIPRPRAAFSELHQGRPVGLIGICGADPALVFEVSSRSADKRRELRIHGTDGVLSWRDEQLWVELHEGDRSSPQSATVKIPFVGESALRTELRTFVEYLRGGPPPPTTAREGAAVVEALLKLRRIAGIADPLLD
jgi:predicted dehydrogenase